MSKNDENVSFKHWYSFWWWFLKSIFNQISLVQLKKKTRSFWLILLSQNERVFIFGTFSISFWLIRSHSGLLWFILVYSSHFGSLKTFANPITTTKNYHFVCVYSMGNASVSEFNIVEFRFDFNEVTTTKNYASSISIEAPECIESHFYADENTFLADSWKKKMYRQLLQQQWEKKNTLQMRKKTHEKMVSLFAREFFFSLPEKERCRKRRW